MKKTLAAMAAALFATTVWAGADCPKNAKSEWMPQDQAKAKITDLGYKIKKFKVDGECYEIYGWDKDGNKAEVYFDTKTLAIVKAEIEKK